MGALNINGMNTNSTARRTRLHAAARAASEVAPNVGARPMATAMNASSSPGKPWFTHPLP